MLEYIILCSSIVEAKRLPITARELAKVIICNDEYYDEVYQILDTMDGRDKEYPYYSVHPDDLLLIKGTSSEAVEIARIAVEIHNRIINA